MWGFFLGLFFGGGGIEFFVCLMIALAYYTLAVCKARGFL